MIDHNNFSDEVTLAPDVYMSDEALDQAATLAAAMVQAVFHKRLTETPMNPHEYSALVVSHMNVLENTLDGYRKILTESMESSEVVSDYLLQLQLTINAFHSISNQMYLVYLNLWDITEGIFESNELTDAVLAASDKVVAQNKEDVKEWVHQNAVEQGLPIPPLQLELDLALT